MKDVHQELFERQENTGDKRTGYELNDGSSTGSWYCGYDEVLVVEMPGESYLVMYADDLALVAADLVIESLKSRVEVALRRIDQWMEAG